MNDKVGIIVLEMWFVWVLIALLVWNAAMDLTSVYLKWQLKRLQQEKNKANKFTVGPWV